MTGSLAPGLGMILDMDGVLVDSNPIHRAAWVEYNRLHGLTTTSDMLEWMSGKRNDEIVRRFFGEGLLPEEVQRRGAEKESLYRQMTGGDVERILVPGVRCFLQQYRTCPLGLATNAEPANVDFILGRGGLREYFRVVVSGQDVQHAKPHPEIYMRTAELLGLEPRNCIVFEDSESGVGAAVAAGMRVIGVCTTHGYLPGTRLDIHNFLSGALHSWVTAQVASV